MTEPQASPWVVLKFGGTSVSSPEAWRTIVSVVRARMEGGESPLVVHSALSGISDLLEALVEAAAVGEWEGLFEELARRHHTLVRALELDDDPALAEALEGELAELRRVLSGIHLLREVTPRAHGRALASGELLATRIGAAVLRSEGIPVRWADARELLRTRPLPHEEANLPRAYLSASCEPRFDAEVAARLRETQAPAASDSGDARSAAGRRAPVSGPPAILTQGFIASNPDGETVVLGRGGSDTSAAYLAVAVGAERLEIWTDVPGLFTADPRLVPTARLLRALAYDEAQEIATTGSKVLHPRCIPAVRDHGIPIQIRSTLDPELEGTVISRGAEGGVPGLKAISAKGRVVLVSMETLGMWQEVGFLARAFDRFRAHGLSVDLVSTSETNVTVSLDAQANTLDRDTLNALVEDLSRVAGVRVIEPCAAISLVGRGIRSLLPRLGPALEVFEEERVHLVAQAANDLNFTFVVDEEQAERVVKKLHHIFLSAGAGGIAVGPTWDEIRARRTGAVVVTPPVPAEWWVEKRDALLDLMRDRDSAYVYDLDTVAGRAARLRTLESVDRVLYAMKANEHSEVLRTARAQGLGIECVSEGELTHAFEVFAERGEGGGRGVSDRGDLDRRAGDSPSAPLDPDEVLFTPNFAPREEYVRGFEAGVHVTVDGLHPLAEWPEVFEGRSIFLRLDTGEGRGHHEKVSTAGPGAKFGIPLDELGEACALAARAGAHIVGLHVHSGSGILDPEHWERNARALADLAGSLDGVRYIDLGGGLGVPDRQGKPSLDLAVLDRGIAEVRRGLEGREIWIEPGRYVVADAGVLLARVTQLKRKGERFFVGLATGMNSLIRPALYGAHHEIVNLTRLGEPAAMLATVVGPICETGDRLGVDRLLPRTEEGDVFLIAQAGAYGRVMGSWYNRRAPADELVI